MSAKMTAYEYFPKFCSYEKSQLRKYAETIGPEWSHLHWPSAVQEIYQLHSDNVKDITDTKLLDILYGK